MCIIMFTSPLTSSSSKPTIQEASLADITYLFETGALIDFEREELIRLVQGLFSDTPLRAKTIEKIRTATVEMSE
jgi:hypothetical protein